MEMIDKDDIIDEGELNRQSERIAKQVEEFAKLWQEKFSVEFDINDLNYFSFMTVGGHLDDLKALMDDKLPRTERIQLVQKLFKIDARIYNQKYIGDLVFNEDIIKFAFKNSVFVNPRIMDKMPKSVADYKDYLVEAVSTDSANIVFSPAEYRYDRDVLRAFYYTMSNTQYPYGDSFFPFDTVKKEDFEAKWYLDLIALREQCKTGREFIERVKQMVAKRSAGNNVAVETNVVEEKSTTETKPETKKTSEKKSAEPKTSDKKPEVKSEPKKKTDEKPKVTDDQPATKSEPTKKKPVVQDETATTVKGAEDSSLVKKIIDKTDTVVEISETATSEPKTTDEKSGTKAEPKKKTAEKPKATDDQPETKSEPKKKTIKKDTSKDIDANVEQVAIPDELIVPVDSDVSTDSTKIDTGKKPTAKKPKERKDSKKAKRQAIYQKFSNGDIKLNDIDDKWFADDEFYKTIKRLAHGKLIEKYWQFVKGVTDKGKIFSETAENKLDKALKEKLRVVYKLIDDKRKKALNADTTVSS